MIYSNNRACDWRIVDEPQGARGPYYGDLADRLGTCVFSVPGGPALFIFTEE